MDGIDDRYLDELDVVGRIAVCVVFNESVHLLLVFDDE